MRTLLALVLVLLSGGAARADDGRSPTLRVLFASPRPTWHQRALVSWLVRQPDLQVQTLLTSASPGYPQPASSGLPALATFPARAALDAYDVVVLEAPRDAIDARTLTHVARFVERGGGLIVVAGADYREPAALRRVLPLARTPRTAWRPGALLAQRRHGPPIVGRPALRLGGLVGLRARAGAGVVATLDGQPAIAGSERGLGSVLMIGTDALWRRRSGGRFGAVWRRAIRWADGRQP